MGEKELVQVNKADTLKWALVGFLLLIGIAANFYFSAVAVPLRLIGWVVLVCVVGLIAYQTHQGRQVWEFAKQAQVELRKVHWPTREETIKVTLIVVLMVFIVAIFLWMMDSGLLWVMGLLTGRRG